jgi:DNA (cytosine-5)-methyltransferase 1
MTAYYNEHDKNAAAWLRELIKAGHIAPGDVDERSIADVIPTELAGYAQCHFFAGIGGWSYALRLAGWPDDRPVWTGSCPCQPFSAAGKGDGFDDERHLWPDWFWLISQRLPGVIFGEQVESAVKHGWLDLVQDDLEGIGYAVGAHGLPACSVGAPHIRQRAWIVADASQAGTTRLGTLSRKTQGEERLRGGFTVGGKLGNANDKGPQGRAAMRECTGEQPVGSASVAGATRGFWNPSDWLPCRDGKARPVEPGTFPLAYGLPARVGRLRGYGNAIVPQVAAEVIKAYMENT